ncbi:UPF0158 family protein [Gordonia sp. ABSL49_1]|uniref:UPF0158 family protein n=1 Tax=Gordonia sp. ABSL49_1 TaxID=2920941 RepID=UPI001F1127A4|nr:UPF0158 family protein [Gordonia sp. ABSL49_1]MCH5643470.1 UPF0158 family protein [Gordonia sp. ABSL49_1]
MADETDRDHALRAATRNDIGQDVIAVLRANRWDDILQAAGEGLLVALASKTDGATELAEQCVAALREREWYGDDELADQIESALGTGATPLLKELKVDLEMISSSLEGDPMQGGGRIDLTDGTVYPDFMFESGVADLDDMGMTEDDLEDPDRWLSIDCEGSRQGYRDMEKFIAWEVEDEHLAELLGMAIEGRGAFRRFRDVLHRKADSHPDMLTRWNNFSDERKTGRAREWLAGNGYRPAIGNPF